jgi:hypothetical protein
MFTLFICGSTGAFNLPDTGQTACYDTSGNVISCAGTGQDGEYNIHPLSYTDNGNGTVTDNNTGLMWQKEDDGFVYNWYQATGTFHATHNPASQNVCGSLMLGSYSDWRLPAKKELITIVDYGIPYPGPAIETTFFPNTKLYSYWSSTTAAHDSDLAFNPGFTAGIVRDTAKSALSYVRCVRGEQMPDPDFIDNGNSTVTDNRTNLIWQQGLTGYLPVAWESALSYCQGLSLGGYSDWRLPNIKELESITDDTRWNPAIDTNYFYAINDDYWSSTTLMYLMDDRALDVLLWYGFVESDTKAQGTSSGNVRCVRT